MKNSLGTKGEDLACDYLLRQGYTILERNYRIRLGEIDIICCKDQDLVFVEVKTRRSATYGSPEEAITPRKQEHIRKVALAYVDRYHHTNPAMRFDVITILYHGDLPVINHIQAAF